MGERIVKFSGVTDDTVGREEILAKMGDNPVAILGAEKVEFIALDGDEAQKAFRLLKDDREALFARLKNKKGGKGGFKGNRSGYNQRAPKNKRTTFDADEPVEKKTKDE